MNELSTETVSWTWGILKNWEEINKANASQETIWRTDVANVQYRHKNTYGQMSIILH